MNVQVGGGGPYEIFNHHIRYQRETNLYTVNAVPVSGSARRTASSVVGDVEAVVGYDLRLEDLRVRLLDALLQLQDLARR